MTPHQARPAGFAVLVGEADRLADMLERWPAADSVEVVCRESDVVVWVFGGDDSVPLKWSNSAGAGVVFGEFHSPEQVGTVLGRSEQPVPHGVASVTTVDSAALDHVLSSGVEGVFCVACWDRQAGELRLFRDNSGGQGLYWYRGDGWIAVASRLDILASMPDVPTVIAPPGLHEYLRFLDVAPPHTVYRGVHAVEAGKDIRVPLDRDAVAANDSTQSGPSAAASGRAARQSSPPAFAACLDRLDEALHAAVADRLERRGATGLFLSGGVDSGLLCAIAADIDRSALDAFTLGFDDTGLDETPVAAAMATHLGVRHHRLHYSLRDYRSAFDHLVAGIDLPFADPAGVPTMLMARDCRKVVEAALEGTGGDELMGEMPPRHARLAIGYADRLPVALRRLGAAMLNKLPYLARYAPILDFDDPEDLLIRWRGWKRQEIEALCGNPVSFEHTSFYRTYRQFSRTDHFSRYSSLLAGMQDDRVHQTAELAGLKLRFPFRDHRVERVVQGLPISYRFTETEHKRLLRSLLARYVPRAIWDLPKHGLDFPFIALMQANDHELVRTYLDPSLLARHPLLDRTVVQRYAQDFVAGNTGLAFRVWALIVLFGWLEYHGIRH